VKQEYRSVEGGESQDTKFSAYLSVYNDWDILEPALRSINPFVDELVVVDGGYEWMAPYLQGIGRDPGKSDHRVYDAIEAAGIPFRIISGVWKSETDKRRAGFHSCRHRFIYRVDADEVFFFNDNLDAFLLAGGAVAQMEMPLYVSPGWILSRPGAIERQSFLFDSKQIDSDAHLKYLWLIGSSIEQPSPNELAVIFPEPIAFNAHLSHWRTPATSVNRAAFYTLNSVRMYGAAWFSDLWAKPVPDLSAFFKHVTPSVFCETLLGSSIVTGHMPPDDAVLKASPLSGFDERNFEYLFTSFLKSHARMNAELASSGRYMLHDVQIDLSSVEAMQAVAGGSELAFMFSSDIASADVAMRYVLPASTWDIVQPLTVEIKGDTLSLDPYQNSDRFGKFLRRVLSMTVSFKSGSPIQRFAPIGRS